MSPTPPAAGDRATRGLYLVLLLMVAGPSIALLAFLGQIGFLMSLGSGLAGLEDAERLASGDAFAALGLALVIASGSVAIVLFLWESGRYLLWGRPGLAGRRRRLLVIHAFALPALVFCIHLAASRIAAQGTEAGELLFALALSGVPILPFSLYLLALSRAGRG